MKAAVTFWLATSTTSAPRRGECRRCAVLSGGSCSGKEGWMRRVLTRSRPSCCRCCGWTPLSDALLDGHLDTHGYEELEGFHPPSLSIPNPLQSSEDRTPSWPSPRRQATSHPPPGRWCLPGSRRHLRCWMREEMGVRQRPLVALVSVLNRRKCHPPLRRLGVVRWSCFNAISKPPLSVSPSRMGNRPQSSVCLCRHHPHIASPCSPLTRLSFTSCLSQRRPFLCLSPIRTPFHTSHQRHPHTRRPRPRASSSSSSITGSPAPSYPSPSSLPRAFTTHTPGLTQCADRCPDGRDASVCVSVL